MDQQTMSSAAAKRHERRVRHAAWAARMFEAYTDQLAARPEVVCRLARLVADKAGAVASGAR